MKYLLAFMLLVAIFVVGQRSCHFNHFGFGVKGSGPTMTETRSVRDFHALDLDLAGDVEVRVGDYNVEVTAQQNILPLLKTVLENGRLRIFFDENVSYTENLKIVVTAPAFDGFSLGGSGEILVVSPLEGDRMVVDIGGSGNVILPQGNFNSLRCSISGSGEIELGGKANNAQVDVSGSGEVHAKNMEFNSLDAHISGSGSVSANVIQTLKAHVSGSGDVRYLGSPNLETHVSGSGEVSRL